MNRLNEAFPAGAADLKFFVPDSYCRIIDLVHILQIHNITVVAPVKLFPGKHFFYFLERTISAEIACFRMIKNPVLVYFHIINRISCQPNLPVFCFNKNGSLLMRLTVFQYHVHF